jgi:hypothetical protein
LGGEGSSVYYAGSTGAVLVGGTMSDSGYLTNQLLIAMPRCSIRISRKPSR